MTADEAMNWLKDFMKEINTQDNRLTASPIYYTVQTQDEDRNVSTHNVFFTEKAVNAYMESESHNYPGAQFYLQHARRNGELTGLLRALGELTKEGYVEH